MSVQSPDLKHMSSFESAVKRSQTINGDLNRGQTMRSTLKHGMTIMLDGGIDIKDDDKSDNKQKITINPKDLAYFNLKEKEINELFLAYDLRTFDEDIALIESLNTDELITDRLKVKTKTGLVEKNKEDLRKRTAVFGINKMKDKEMPHFCTFVYEALEDTLVRMLILAALVQTAIGASPLSDHPEADWVDGMSIIVAVIIVLTVTSVTNYSKEKKFLEVNEGTGKKGTVEVKRNGIFKDISEDELVVGDIVKIKQGRIVPADGLVLDGLEILIDESSLTGETDLIVKDTLKNCIQKRDEALSNNKLRPEGKHIIPSPIILSGSQLKEGYAIFLVLAVGNKSKIGKIKQQIRDSKEKKAKTPLENKLEKIATDIGYFGISAGVLTFIALISRFIKNFLERQKEETDYFQRRPWYENNVFDEQINIGSFIIIERGRLLSRGLIEIILICIAIVVVAIPEGLPLAVTLSLAFSINKMMDDNNHVRKMAACEIMGGANIICTDKTGTLTQNIMVVNRVFDNSNNLDVLNIVSLLPPGDTIEHNKIFPNQKFYTTFVHSILLNLDIEINQDNTIKRCPSKTDEAIYEFMLRLGENPFKMYKSYFPSDIKNLKRIPFNSIRKKMSTIVSHSDYILGHRIFLKGAAELVLESCRYYLDPNTSSKKLISDEEKAVFEKMISGYTSSALRTICLAYKDIDDAECEKWKDIDEKKLRVIEESDFTLTGIIGIRDILREGVEIAVDNCKKAGIQAIMVTGDNLETAIAVARESRIIIDELPMNCSILGPDFYKAIEGVDCETCNEEKENCKCDKNTKKHKIHNIVNFEKVTKGLKIMARSRPEDKYALVIGLKELNNVVAVTGDGTNDAPSLIEADVGFAMGIQGTEIAKDAADIIITDDNFSSLVKSVIWGRNIYENIRKFITFQLTVNLCAVLFVFISACYGNDIPITPIQLLWVNLIMDSLGSLALSTEKPYDELLERKPYSRGEYIISSIMMKHILLQSLMQLALLLLIYLNGSRFIPEDDITRLSQTKALEICYNYQPGKFYPKPLNYSLSLFPGVIPEEIKSNITFILSGSNEEWKINYKLQRNVTMKDCPNFYFKAVDLNLAYDIYIENYSSTAHFTIIFNVFVFYTLINQVNSRIIDGSFNVFTRFFNNYLFVIILFFECIIQVIIIQYASVAFKTCEGGLTPAQWGVSIGLSCIAYFWDLAIRFIPMENFFNRLKDMIDQAEIEKKEQQEYEEELNNKIEVDTEKKKEEEEDKITCNNLDMADMNVEMNFENNGSEKLGLSQNNMRSMKKVD